MTPKVLPMPRAGNLMAVCAHFDRDESMEWFAASGFVLLDGKRVDVTHAVVCSDCYRSYKDPERAAVKVEEITALDEAAARLGDCRPAWQREGA